MVDIIFGLSTILFGIFVFWEALNLPKGVLSYALDLGLFPKIVATTLILFGILLIIQSIRHKRKYTDVKLISEPVIRVVLLILLTMSYVFLWGKIGTFLLNTFIFILMAHIVMKFKLISSILSSIFVTFFTYLFFAKILSVVLF